MQIALLQLHQQFWHLAEKQFGSIVFTSVHFIWPVNQWCLSCLGISPTANCDTWEKFDKPCNTIAPKLLNGKCQPKWCSNSVSTLDQIFASWVHIFKQKRHCGKLHDSNCATESIGKWFQLLHGQWESVIQWSHWKHLEVEHLLSCDSFWWPCFPKKWLNATIHHKSPHSKMHVCQQWQMPSISRSCISKKFQVKRTKKMLLKAPFCDKMANAMQWFISEHDWFFGLKHAKTVWTEELLVVLVFLKRTNVQRWGHALVAECQWVLLSDSPFSLENWAVHFATHFAAWFGPLLWLSLTHPMLGCIAMTRKTKFNFQKLDSCVMQSMDSWMMLSMDINQANACARLLKTVTSFANKTLNWKSAIFGEKEQPATRLQEATFVDVPKNTRTARNFSSKCENLSIAVLQNKEANAATKTSHRKDFQGLIHSTKLVALCFGTHSLRGLCAVKHDATQTHTSNSFLNTCGSRYWRPMMRTKQKTTKYSDSRPSIVLLFKTCISAFAVVGKHDLVLVDFCLFCFHRSFHLVKLGSQLLQLFLLRDASSNVIAKFLFG